MIPLLARGARASILLDGPMGTELEARGLGVQGLVVDSHTPTGITVVLSKGNDRAILTHPGTIAELRSDRIDRGLLNDARHVHVSSYFLQAALRPDLPMLFDEVHARGATTSVDPNWDPPVTLGVRLVSVLSDDLQHVGQAAFVRGLL
jgi:sugar/nucleoside kinase (ribokinase family)